MYILWQDTDDNSDVDKDDKQGDIYNDTFTTDLDSGTDQEFTGFW